VNSVLYVKRYIISSMLSSEKLESKSLATKLTPVELQEIENLVSAGLYLNSSDFLRDAVRERLRAIKVIKLKDIDYETAKKEVLGYYKEYEKAFLSDVSNDLELDLELVVKITDELIKESRIKEVI